MNSFNQKFKKQMGFESLSLVQEKVLAHANDRDDLIITSATGTGKTHAFLFAIMERLDIQLMQTQAIILAPTRELAMQIMDFAKAMQTIDHNLTLALAIGGMDNTRLEKEIEKQPHIIIATPGKFMDVLTWNRLRLDFVEICIIDEMDMMFDYGFIEDIDHIASHLQNETNIYLFSATLPKGLQNFVRKYLRSAQVIDVPTDERLKPRINHYLINTRHREPNKQLLELITTINPLLCVVFANTIEEVESAADFLKSYGLACVSFHGDLESRRRKQILREIENQQVQYVVASDLAARGIDLPEISHVINLGLPSHDLDFYMHRAGRTGRSGREGYAMSLVSKSDEVAIKKLMERGIEFEFKQISKDGLVDARSFVSIDKPQFKQSYDPEIAQIVARKKKKVKPGYKKKQQQEIDRLNKRRRRLEYREMQRANKKKR